MKRRRLNAHARGRNDCFHFGFLGALRVVDAMKSEAMATAILVAAIIGLGGYSVILQKRLTGEREERHAAQATAAMCNAAVQDLEAEAKARAASAAAAVAEAEKAAADAMRRADEILKRPAAVPGDDCHSAKIRAQAWLKGRKL